MEQVEAQILPNPADRPYVTFDTNIILALRNNEPAAQPIRHLLALNRAGIIDVNVTLSTALEEQRPDEKREMHEYSVWLQEQGIAPGNIFTHPRSIGFRVPGTDPDTPTYDAELEYALNERVHSILFPNIPFTWYNYRDQECKHLNIVDAKRKAMTELDAARWNPLSQRPTPALDALEQTEREELLIISKRLLRTWRNAKSDALGLYNHITQAAHTTHPEWAIFVTNDRNFWKQTKLEALRRLGFLGEILPPEKAVAFICKVTGASLQETEPENPMVG